jgi:hypothetical protein
MKKKFCLENMTVFVEKETKDITIHLPKKDLINQKIKNQYL